MKQLYLEINTDTDKNVSGEMPVTAVRNITCSMYQKHSPVPEAHTYAVLDYTGKCILETDTYEEAKRCYLEQPDCYTVGAWLVYAYYESEITLN